MLIQATPVTARCSQIFSRCYCLLSLPYSEEPVDIYNVSDILSTPIFR
jgi:hypothetical protein